MVRDAATAEGADRGRLYHVYNRCARGEPVFSDREEAVEFVELPRAVVKRDGLTVFAMKTLPRLTGLPLTGFHAAVEWLSRSPGRAFLVIFLLGFCARLYFLTLIPEEHLLPQTRWEMSAIAVSLAESGQFADPYMISTGPTAHLPPVAPGILALFYRLLGLTVTAGFVSRLWMIACYSAVFGLLPWLGCRFGTGTQAGVLAGIAGALMPRWPAHGESLMALALILLMTAFLKRWTSARRTPGGSLALGMACGLAFHLQPVLLPVVMGWLVFELLWSPARRRWLPVLVVVVGIAFACIPWGARNYAVFHEIFFIRSNFGLELRMGNHEGAAAAMDVMDRDVNRPHRHPRINLGDAQKLKELGEPEYMRQARREALSWILSHPGRFLVLTGQRVIHFWCGPLHRPTTAIAITALTALALLGTWTLLPRLTGPQRAVLLIPLATYPLIYYVVPYMGRYRRPIDWILLLLAAAALWRWVESRDAPPEAAA